MKYCWRLLVLAAAMALAGGTIGGWGWLLIWPAVSFGLVAVGYGLGRADIYGKKDDGRLPPARVALLLPYFFLVWVTWRTKRRLCREAPYNLVLPGLYLGRRPLSEELPKEVDLVIDLAGEFPAAGGIAAKGRYISRPMLDGSAMDPDEFAHVARRVADWKGTVYVHCAEGHGRSASLVAAILIFRGAAGSVDDALEIIKKVRPAAHLNREQRAMVQAAVAAP